MLDLILMAYDIIIICNIWCNKYEISFLNDRYKVSLFSYSFFSEEIIVEFNFNYLL